MIIKIKKSQVKSVFIVFLLALLIILMGYALETTLTSPDDSSTDTDGSLALTATCEPTDKNVSGSYTNYNITNATLWTNVGGTWKVNSTINIGTPTENTTRTFVFTSMNVTPEGTYIWNVECQEANSSKSSGITKAFAGNRTVIVSYAKPTVTTLSPVDSSYDMDGTNILINCSATPSTGWNLTSLSLYIILNGTWLRNITQIVPSGDTGQYQYKFIFNDTTVSLDKDLTFACAANQTKYHAWNNKGIIVNITDVESSSANRTLNIERPPAITLNTPADNNWSKNKRVNVSWLVSSAYGSNVAPFPCQVWTNETGVWTSKTGGINVDNNTYYNLYVDFQERADLRWGVKCQDANDGNVWNMSSNRTIRIDTSTPTISSVTPTNNSYLSVDNNLTIVFTPSDTTNLSGVKVYLQGKENYTNTSLISGTQITHRINVTLPDAKYNFSIWANDSSGRTYTTGNYTVTIDRTVPSIGLFLNYTASIGNETYCDQVNITWDTNESTNYTVYIDTDTEVSGGNVFRASNFTLNHSVIFDFNYSGEISHSMNISVCDQSDNCNYSQRTFITPARVCAGWSQYAIYDSVINLSVIQNQSGADLVYFWNATDQTWTYFTAGLTANRKVAVGKNTDYHVVHLYENINSTWYRNQSGATTLYKYNVTSTANFINVPGIFNFGNLTYSFMNTSKDYPSFINNEYTNFSNYGPFNITYFAGYNNSVQDYVSHIFNFTWSNASILEPCPTRNYRITCMETFWVASGFNVSWNGTGIYANWTAA